MDVTAATLEVVQHGARGQLVERRVSFLEYRDRDDQGFDVVVSCDLDLDGCNGFGFLD
jgi:hypothetical protein